MSTESSRSHARAYFRALESDAAGTTYPLGDILQQVRFNSDGLIPAVAQEAVTGEVLMLAWMNRESLELTLSSGRMTYWSRSRQALWLKGESSGCFQVVESASLDCDGDALLFRVHQTGGACHTGRRSCFYLAMDATQGRVTMAND